MPNDHKICHDPKNVRKIYRHLPLQDPAKITQIAIFGLKIYHLATLLKRRVEKIATSRKLEIPGNEVSTLLAGSSPTLTLRIAAKRTIRKKIKKVLGKLESHRKQIILEKISQAFNCSISRNSIRSMKSLPSWWQLHIFVLPGIRIFF
jgi:hypothetical protein